MLYKWGGHIQRFNPFVPLSHTRSKARIVKHENQRITPAHFGGGRGEGGEGVGWSVLFGYNFCQEFLFNYAVFSNAEIYNVIATISLHSQLLRPFSSFSGRFSPYKLAGNFECRGPHINLKKTPLNYHTNSFYGEKSSQRSLLSALMPFYARFVCTSRRALKSQILSHA